MHDRNLITVYHKSGATAEVTRLNAHDLTTHHGWTYDNLVSAATPAPTKPAPAAPVTKPAEAAEQAPAAPVTEITEAPTDKAEDATEQTEGADFKTRYTVEDFDDLADKKDVAAYIEQAFPGTKIDGRANREKLIGLAIELAAGAE